MQFRRSEEPAVPTRLKHRAIKPSLCQATTLDDDDDIIDIHNKPRNRRHCIQYYPSFHPIPPVVGVARTREQTTTAGFDNASQIYQYNPTIHRFEV